MQSHRSHHPARKGFTLVESLIVIAMIAILSLIVLSLMKGAKATAKLAQRTSTLKDCGGALLSHANEHFGRFEYWAAGDSGFKYAHYYIAGDFLGWNDGVCEPMHWDIKLLPPAPKGVGSRWKCAGVNFSNFPELGVNWETSEFSNVDQWVRRLTLHKVTRPNGYPFLLDASTSSGTESFRVNVGSNDLPAMRVKQRTNAFFLDGSCRILDRAGLKKAGFTEAYDNSTKPPKRIKL